MPKLTLTDITTSGTGFDVAINTNNTLLEAALENTLSRDGSTPNTMAAALDMNSNTINNLKDGAGQQAATVNQVSTLVAAAGASLPSGPIASSLVTLIDAGGLYTGVDAETALQEIGVLPGNLASNANALGASLIGIEDAAADFTATTVEAALAELFTGAFTYVGVQTFTAQPIFKSVDGIQVQDTGGVDKFTISLDGTDVNFNGTGITDLDFAGFTAMNIAGTLVIQSNNILQISGATDSVFLQISRTATNTDFTPSSSGDTLKFRDGQLIRFQDSGDTDWIQFEHDGLDFQFSGVNTNDVVFSGMQGLDFGSTDIGFYGTSPIAKQTGVAVSAAAIHAALVAIGLIGV